MTQEQVAEAIGISVEMVRRHERGDAQPRQTLRARYSGLYGASPSALGIADNIDIDPWGSVPDHGIDRLIDEISESSVGADAIDSVFAAVVDLAEKHTCLPARTVLGQLLVVRVGVQRLLGRRLRLRHTRDLYKAHSDLLAHCCVLVGDLGRNEAALRYGLASLAYAREAGADASCAYSAVAKTLRWAGRPSESASAARAGYVACPANPIRVQLASQEANAAALLGDVGRARAMLAVAEGHSDLFGADSGRSIWSFPAARLAVFALSVSNQAGDSVGALRATHSADAAWRTGAPVVPATWAQIRVGAAIARLNEGDVSGALTEATPVLALPPDQRVSTVTAYLLALDRALTDSPARGMRPTVEMCEAIRTFVADALPPAPATR